jgi:pilus assembly protein Flp/PilA
MPYRVSRAGRVNEASIIFGHVETGMQKIRTFLKNAKGATAIEYGLIAALIAVAAIAAMSGLGNQLKTTFQNVASNVKVQ